MYNDNLIVDSAHTVTELEQQMKVLLYDFEDVDAYSIAFTHGYDV